jgi:hypothetical protein
VGSKEEEMTVRELIQKLESAPQESEIRIKNPDGTTRPMTLVGFHHKDGTEVGLAGRNPFIQIAIP